MTRYSRSVIPGRTPEEERAERRSLDEQLFGPRKASVQPANDPAPPPFDNDPESRPAGPRVNNARAAAPDNDDAPSPATADADDDAIASLRILDHRNGVDRRVSQRRKSDYAPLPSSTGVRRSGGQGGSRATVLMVGALVVLGVFGAVVYNSYRDGTRAPDEVAAPLLAAQGPIKTRSDAAEPSASRADNASVFERLEGPSAAEKASVKSGEPEVAPEVREAPRAAPSAAAAVPPLRTGSGEPAGETAVEKALRETAPVALTPAATSAPSTPATAAPVKVETPKPAPTPAQAAPSYSFSAAGAYQVQLAAAGSQAAAESEWTRRRNMAPDLFNGGQKIIMQAEVNGRSVYRARIGNFATASEADAFCDALKARGGDCYRAVK
ncbi:MAG: SPOR domain-containing protein [Hyphomonadaceae bacterium]